MPIVDIWHSEKFFRIFQHRYHMLQSRSSRVLFSMLIKNEMNLIPGDIFYSLEFRKFTKAEETSEKGGGKNTEDDFSPLFLFSSLLSI